jgi:hypothetical protein
MNSPDGDPLAAVVVCYNGSVEAGERVLRPLLAFGLPLADEVAPMPYCKVQTLFDEAFIRGRCYYFKSNFTRSISDAAIATLVEHFVTAPSPLSMLYFQQLGNSANWVGATATAFSHRDALCEWGCDAVWVDARHSQHPLGPRTRGGDAPIHDRQRLRQPYRPRSRRGDGSHQGGLCRELRSARGFEEQKRSDKPVSPQPEPAESKGDRPSSGRPRATLFSAARFSNSRCSTSLSRKRPRRLCGPLRMSRIAPNRHC